MIGVSIDLNCIGLNFQPLPSGKLLHNSGKPPFLMGKSTNFLWAIFYVAAPLVNCQVATRNLTVYQRMNTINYHESPLYNHNQH